MEIAGAGRADAQADPGQATAGRRSRLFVKKILHKKPAPKRTLPFWRTQWSSIHFHVSVCPMETRTRLYRLVAPREQPSVKTLQRYVHHAVT